MVVSAVAEGRITPSEAESLARLLDAQMRVVEFEALAQRVDKLENGRTPIETGVTAGPTLAWIAENYSLEIRDSRNIVQPSVEPANGSEADGPTVPPSDLRSTR